MTAFVQVLCLLMPFFVPASATEIQDVSILFLVRDPVPFFARTW